MLRATTACTFSTSQLPKVVRTWCVLYIFLTWKCASRHNGVQFFISHLASWLRTRRFSEPTFRPSGATNHWKNTVFRDFPTFSRTWIFFLLKLSLSSSLLFSDSSHLCFSSVHIAGSLTSKPPSTSTNLLRYITQHYYLHYATLITTLHKLHCTNYTTQITLHKLHYNYIQLLQQQQQQLLLPPPPPPPPPPQLQLQLQLHYIALQYTKLQHITATNATATTLHYTTLHYTNYVKLHYNCKCHYIALRENSLQLQLHYFTLQHARLHYTMPRYSTQHYSTLPYTTLITPHHNCNCNCATLITHNYTTLQLYNYNLKLQLHYTTTTTTPTTALHHTTSSSCGEVTTATIAAAPENTTPTTFLSISGFALPSRNHSNQPLL